MCWKGRGWQTQRSKHENFNIQHKPLGCGCFGDLFSNAGRCWCWHVALPCEKHEASRDPVCCGSERNTRFHWVLLVLKSERSFCESLKSIKNKNLRKSESGFWLELKEMGDLLLCQIVFSNYTVLQAVLVWKYLSFTWKVILAQKGRCGLSREYSGVDFKQEFEKKKKSVAQENTGMTSLEHSKILKFKKSCSLIRISLNKSVHSYRPSFNYHNINY